MRSIYDEDPPYASMDVGDMRREVHGDHVIYVTATAEAGIHSGRRRFRVYCTTCKVLVHPGTTGPQQNVEYHLNQAARGQIYTWPEKDNKVDG